MTENTESTPSRDDDDLPVYLPPGGPQSVAGFSDRLAAHLAAGPDEPEFTFEGVDVEEAQGVWLYPVVGYDPGEDRSLSEGATPDPARPPGGYAQMAGATADEVRRALRDTWGEPLVRTPRLVGVSQEPEGILDYIMVAVGFEEAEMWERGEFAFALMTGWDGEPLTSVMRQAMVVLPREYAFGGWAALADDEVTVHDRLMHGEHPLELRRRAWLMSTMFGQGEVRVRGTAAEASRFSVRRRDATTSVWTFADDGRILVLVYDPASEFVTKAADQLIADQLLADESPEDGRGEGDALREEAQLILITRIVDGVPEDLRELIAAPAEDRHGQPAQHEVEFRMLGGRPLPLISGIAWFDGEHWRVPASLLEIGSLNDLGMDGVGFAEAVRRPFRLGAPFTAGDVPGAADPVRREEIERLFAACPYPEQPRPAEHERLGYGCPAEVTHDELVAQIEDVIALWGHAAAAESAPRPEPFRVGGRTLSGSDDRLLNAVVAVAEPWTIDVLRAWVDGLSDAMEARWGPASTMSGLDPQSGLERRSPVARVMRGTGLMTAPIWWVNGCAVLLIAGIPDRSYDDRPQAILVIARADAVFDLMRGTWLPALRQRARLLATLSSLTSGAPEPDEIAWDGPALTGFDAAPPAVRGRQRTGDHFWVWHFTHDGRALLMSFRVTPEGPAPSFDEQIEQFTGLPADLLSLVVDRDPHGLYPTVERETAVAGAGPLHVARTLPAARAVIWFDQHDWRVSEGMHAAAVAHDAADPHAWLVSTERGVGQLLWAWVAGDGLSTELFSDPRYARHVLDRMPAPAEVAEAYARLGEVHERALTGTLNQFLDVATDMPGGRYVLDAALANPVPQHRREIALQLLERSVDASVQLSHLTPINVLFENPTLDAGDLPLLLRLLDAGACPGPGLGGPGVARDPLSQLAERGVDESVLAPLIEALQERR